MSALGDKRLIVLTAAGVPVLFALLYPFQTRIDAETRGVQQQKEALLLTSGTLLKKISLGYSSLLADVYWTRAVQYYGGKIRDNDPHFELLWPLLNLATSLDPHLIVAYRVGSIFLSEPPPAGAGRNDLASELLRRGIAANPQEWRLWADLGFLYYWYIKDYPQASKAYLEGSKIPDAPVWLKMMAARITESGGSYEASRFLWSEIYNSTRDPNVQKMAVFQLSVLQAEEQTESLEHLAAEFRQRFGHFPASPQELVAAGMLPGIPVDPAGYPYVFEPGGKVRVNPSSPIAKGLPKPMPRK